MTNTKEQVLEMIAAKRISADDGEALLAALQGVKRSKWRMLVDPFERLTAMQSGLVAAIAATGGLLLSRWGVRFDGAFDLHLLPGTVSLGSALADEVVALPLPAAALWLAGFAVVRRGRFVDYLGAVGVARLPLLLVGFVAGSMRGVLPVDPVQAARAPSMIVLGLTSVPGIVWTGVLLFNGFKTASGLQRWKGTSFAVGVVVAEIVSKIVLRF